MILFSGISLSAAQVPSCDDIMVEVFKFKDYLKQYRPYYLDSSSISTAIRYTGINIGDDEVLRRLFCSVLGNIIVRE